MSTNNNNAWTSMFFGGVPHPWLQEYVTMSQKMQAFPFFFWSQSEINELLLYKEEKKTNPDAEPPSMANEKLLDSNTSLLNYAMSLKEDMELEEGMSNYFGYYGEKEEGDQFDIGTFARLYESGRPPWVRVWTTISQHKRTYDEIKGVLPDEEVGRRTYILSNDAHTFDYGFAKNDRMTFTGGALRDNTSGHLFAQEKFEGNESLVKNHALLQRFIPKEGLSNGTYLNPNARIKDVSIDVKGKYMGATKLCTITFDVYNKNDFYDIYQRYFLTPGAQLVVDIGRTNIAPYDITELVDLNNDDAIDDVGGALDNKIKDLRFGSGKQSPACCDTFIGKVQKFDAKSKPNKWECTITLVSKNAVSMNTTTKNNKDFSEKFVNSLDTYAILSTIGEILPEKFLYDIWNVNWLETAGVEDITALIGNTALSGQYVVKTGSEEEDNEAFTYGVHSATIGGNSQPIVAPSRFSQETGVYVQRLANSKNDGSSIGSPALNNNVYVSINWIERVLLNPLLNDSAASAAGNPYGFTEGQGRNIFKGTFSTPDTSFCNFSANLAKQRLFSNKARHNFVWFYGCDVTEGLFGEQTSDKARADTEASDAANGFTSDNDGIRGAALANATQALQSAILANMFVHTSIVKEALSLYTKVREIYMHILSKISQSTSNFMDLQIVPIDGEGTGMKVIDVNFDNNNLAIIEEWFPGGQEAYTAQYESAEQGLMQQNYDVWGLKPILSPYAPGSVIRDIDFGFNIASDKQASMIAIQGAAGNKMFSLNNAAATSEFTGLSSLYKEFLTRPDYGWQYLPDTTRINKEESQSALDNYLVDWHEHVPDALNIGEMYQGLTEESKEYIKSQNIKNLKGANINELKELISNAEATNDEADWGEIFKKVYGEDVSDKSTESWTPEKRKALLKKVAKLDEDIVKKKEELYELDASNITTEVIETEDGTKEKWVYARDLHHYYELRHLKQINNNSQQDGDNMPRYNPPVAGMTLELTLNGMFGWKIGDSFRLDELPPNLIDRVYFIVTGVNHSIRSGQWTTKLKCLYKVRASLRFSPDMDWIPQAYKHTYIGLSPSYIKSMGFTDVVAESLKRWKPGESFMDDFLGQYYDSDPSPPWMQWDDIGVILFYTNITDTLIDFLKRKEDGEHMLVNQQLASGSTDFTPGSSYVATDYDVGAVLEDDKKTVKIQIAYKRNVKFHSYEGAYQSFAHLQNNQWDDENSLSGNDAFSVTKEIGSNGKVTDIITFNKGEDDGLMNFYEHSLIENPFDRYYDNQAIVDNTRVAIMVPETLAHYSTETEYVGFTAVDVIQSILSSEWGQKSGYTQDGLLDELGISTQRYKEILSSFTGDVAGILDQVSFNQWSQFTNGGEPIKIPSEYMEYVEIDMNGHVNSIKSEFVGSDEFMGNIGIYDYRSTSDVAGITNPYNWTDKNGDTQNLLWSRELYKDYEKINGTEWEIDVLNDQSQTNTLISGTGTDGTTSINNEEPPVVEETNDAVKNYWIEKMNSSNKSSSGPCFDGFGKVSMSDGSIKLVRNILVGDEVKTENGTARISKIYKEVLSESKYEHHFIDGEYKFYEHNGLQLTSHHWVNIDNEWVFPKDVFELVDAKDEYMYNFELDTNGNELYIDYPETDALPNSWINKDNIYINDILVSSTSDIVLEVAELANNTLDNLGINRLSSQPEIDKILESNKSSIRTEMLDLIESLDVVIYQMENI